MSDTILIDGDLADFLPLVGVTVVIPQPGKLTATGKATINGKQICVDGDEASVKVENCVYFTPIYSIPGKGTLKIKALAGDQLAQKTHSGGKAMLLKGSLFDSVFEVATPAKQPPPGPGAPQPDQTPSYSGKGSFTPANTIFTGA